MTNNDEWRRLYEAVRAVCSVHGKEDAFGDGDFWVVDDSWGGVAQKIVVTNQSFLTRLLVSHLQDCINKLDLLGAEIVVVLEDASSKMPQGGLVIHSSGFEEYWDISKLRAKHGASFFS